MADGAACAGDRPHQEALAREAILEYIDDLEDFYLAEARARKNRKTIPLEDVERELGLGR